MMNRLAAVMVVMVMGLTAWGAKAATGTDNLEIEVNVTITGTVDLTLAGSTGTGVSVGTGSSSGTANTDANFAADKVTWTIPSPDLALTYTTDGSILLDNIGKKKVAVTAQVLAASVDTGAAVGKWNMAAVPTVSKFALGIKLTATGAAGNDPVIAAAVDGIFGSLGAATAPIVTPPSAGIPGTLVSLVSGFKKQHDPVKIDLEYKTPTDITDNNEFDASHIVTITLAGAAD